MGFENFINETESVQPIRRFRHYPHDPRADEIEEWIEEYQDRFPAKVQCDFVEIATRDVQYYGKAYWRQREGETIQYMRVSEKTFEQGIDFTRGVVLHEMVHLYLYQEDFWRRCNITEKHPIFIWLCGAVGANHESVKPADKLLREDLEFFSDVGVVEENY